MPHTQTTRDYSVCAYTIKVVNFCRMMKSLGHEVFLYASEDNDAPCDELITCITKDQQKEMIPSNDWKKDFFNFVYDSSINYWQTMNANIIKNLARRLQPKDFICLIGGRCQRIIADTFSNHMSVEFGVGYEGVFSKYRVFESYAHMHYIYGLLKQKNGNSYDAVIPNYFDPDEFPFAVEKDEYFLFVGRIISRKGIEIAAEVCKILGKKLIVAGQGVTKYENGVLESQEIKIDGDIDYLGTVNSKQRGHLMARAKALFCLTQYIGPFESVHVEAMLCGTPIITTDWGVFNETVKDGITGYRTRTLGEALWAAQNVNKLDPSEIRENAVKQYSLNVVRYRYQDYFNQLLGLWDKGFYTIEYDPADKRINGNFN